MYLLTLCGWQNHGPSKMFTSYFLELMNKGHGEGTSWICLSEGFCDREMILNHLSRPSAYTRSSWGSRMVRREGAAVRMKTGWSDGLPPRMSFLYICPHPNLSPHPRPSLNDRHLFHKAAPTAPSTSQISFPQAGNNHSQESSWYLLVHLPSEAGKSTGSRVRKT